jgi:hypothetical protein
MFDVLIIGGVSSIGLCKIKNLQLKKTNFHSSKSSSQEAIFNNAYGFLQEHWAQICCHKALISYPHVTQIPTKKS